MPGASACTGRWFVLGGGGAVVLVVFVGLLIRLAPARTRRPGPAGWSAQRLCALALVMTVIVAATDAALGHHVVLIGLLIIGPCCALFTGRWVLTGVIGLWVVGRAIVLGVPDGIWDTRFHLVFVAAVAGVACSAR